MNLTRFRPNLTSNTALAFAAFFIAFSIWTIAKQDELMEEDLQVPVRVNAPAYARISVQPRQVDLTLRFPVSQANLLASADLYINLGALAGDRDPLSWAAGGGELTMEIDAKNVANLPRTFQVAEIQDSRVTLTGELYTHEAVVEPNITGQPGEGYYASRPFTYPQTIQLIGAPDDLDRLNRNANGEVIVATTPIDIRGKTENLEVRDARIVLPENILLGEEESGYVTVTVPIREQTGRQVIRDIPIVVEVYTGGLEARVQPVTASVRVEGPLSLIQSLQPEDLRVFPREPIDERPGAEISVTLDVQFAQTAPQQARDKVNIVTDSLIPKSANVRIIDLEGEGVPSTAPSTQPAAGGGFARLSP